MNHDAVMQRQRELLIRSAQLRLSLTEQAQFLKRPLALADDARSGLQWLSRHPQWPLGALTVAVVMRPARAIRWGTRLWWAWNSFQRAKNWLASSNPPR